MHVSFHTLKAFQVIILCGSNATTGMDKTGKKGAQVFAGVLPFLVSPDTRKTAKPLLHVRIGIV